MQLLADFLRYGCFVLAGLGVGFMVMTNVIAFKVLRPPQTLGFLWWHVTAISLSFFMVGMVAMDNVVSRIGEPVSWRAPMMFIGCLLFATAQAIIFTVERSRLVQAQAVEILNGSG